MKKTWEGIQEEESILLVADKNRHKLQQTNHKVPHGYMQIRNNFLSGIFIPIGNSNSLNYNTYKVITCNWMHH